MARGTRFSNRDVRQLLLDAALAQFSRRGFHGTTIDDVAKGAKLTKGAVYWYFKSKDALFFSLLERELSLLEDVLRPLINDQTKSASARIERIVTSLFDHYTRRPEYCKVLQLIASVANSKQAGKIASWLSKVYRETRDMAHTVLRAGIDRGEFSPTCLRSGPALFVALIEGLTYQWLADPSSIDLEEAAHDTARLFLSGILAG